MKKKYKTGLVLSGGAARGFAHAGVMKALREKNISPDVISGVSAGSIAGAFFADGYEPDEILDIFQKKKVFEFVRLSFTGSGLLDISGLKKVLEDHLHARKIEDLKTSFYVCVTNFRTGKPEYLNKGDLVSTVVASSSIPVLFKPAKINHRIYFDGGVTDNLPVEPIRDRCKKIIGVHVNPVGEEEFESGLVKIAARSFHVSVASGIEQKKEFFKYFIEPQELRKYLMMDVSKGKEMFNAGYREAIKIL